MDNRVAQANKQLGIANTKKTFLVFIESHSAKKPSELEKAFTHLHKSSYSGISYVYFVEGCKVTEIQLPST